jgi:peptide/nickel transport system substrate-binding protein
VSRTKPVIWALAVLVSLALVASACGKSSKKSTGATGASTEKVKKGGTLRYAADQEPTGFNNDTSKDNGTSVVNVMIRVWPSTFFIDPKFNVVMDKELLDSAEVTNQDPETIVYKINKNAKWSDGVDINADDFIYNWKAQSGDASLKDVDDKPYDVASTTGYEDIQSVTGSDNGKTVTVVFKKKYSDWKALFSQSIVPAHIAKTKGWNDGFDKFDPAVVVSGGPFKIQSYNVGKDLTLAPNEKYWGTKPNLDSIVFRFITDSAQQVPALQNNEVDMIYPQPQLDLLNQVNAISGINHELTEGLSFEHLDFNFKNAFLKDPAVRKAFAKALDRKAIVTATVGQLDPKAVVDNNRIYVPNQPEYQDTSGGQYDAADPNAAKTALTADGFKLGADGIFTKGGKRLSLRLSTTAGNALREAQGLLIQAQEKAAGIDIKIDNSPSKVLFGTRLPKGDFDVANFAWVATPFASSNKSIYATVPPGQQTQNYDSYSNPTVDAAMTAATGELDATKVKSDWNAIDKMLWDDMVTIPLYQKPTYVAYRNTFANIHDNASSNGPLWNAETFGLKG